MKNLYAAVAFLGLTLMMSSVPAFAGETDKNATAESGLSASADTSTRAERMNNTFAWEENLKDSPAAHSLVKERQTGIPSGVNILGGESGEIW